MTALTVGGVALAVSSNAWACTTFKGKVVVAGNAGTGLVTAVGNNTQQGWCPGHPIGKAKATLNGTVTVTVTKAGADACVDRMSKLSPGSYTVTYANGEAFTRSDSSDKSNFDGSRRIRMDCTTLTQDTVPLGLINIDGSGRGSGTYTLPVGGRISGPTDEAAICVTNLDEANQVPLTIV